MTGEERERLNIMEEEYHKMLLVQDEEYDEQEHDDDNQWRINGISPWEL